MSDNQVQPSAFITYAPEERYNNEARLSQGLYKRFKPTPVKNHKINGGKYTGTLVDGLPHGEGVETLANGAKYEGNWKDGKQDGQGVETLANGAKYEGEWKNGMQHGKGVMTWKNRMIQRQGRTVFIDGNKYEGEWKDGKQDGKGVFTDVNGNKYEGEWKDGKQDGHGVMTWASGELYEGELKDGKRHGKGVFTDVNGNRYEGEWKDGKRDGMFTKTACDGIQTFPYYNNGALAYADSKVGASNFITSINHASLAQLLLHDSYIKNTVKQQFQPLLKMLDAVSDDNTGHANKLNDAIDIIGNIIHGTQDGTDNTVSLAQDEHKSLFNAFTSLSSKKQSQLLHPNDVEVVYSILDDVKNSSTKQSSTTTLTKQSMGI